ncbi:hypothetical protein [Synechococcus sp. MIT S9509]|nr:hypothetical protein [Synechococcus sp. MIT S9509]
MSYQPITSRRCCYVLVFCIFYSDHPLGMPFITTRADHRFLKTLLIGAVF